MKIELNEVQILTMQILKYSTCLVFSPCIVKTETCFSFSPAPPPHTHILYTHTFTASRVPGYTYVSVECQWTLHWCTPRFHFCSWQPVGRCRWRRASGSSTSRRWTAQSSLFSEERQQQEGDPDDFIFCLHASCSTQPSTFSRYQPSNHSSSVVKTQVYSATVPSSLPPLCQLFDKPVRIL